MSSARSAGRCVEICSIRVKAVLLVDAALMLVSVLLFSDLTHHSNLCVGISASSFCMDYDLEWSLLLGGSAGSHSSPVYRTQVTKINAYACFKSVKI